MISVSNVPLLCLLQWDKLSAVTGFTPSSLTPCLNDLVALFSEAATLPHPAIRDKYAKDKYVVEPHNMCHIPHNMF